LWKIGCNEFLQTYLSAWSAKFGEVSETLPTKQPYWDRPGVLEDKALVEATLSSAYHRASFLAAFIQHSEHQWWALVAKK